MLGYALAPHSRGYLILCLLLSGPSLAPPRIPLSSVDFTPPLNIADLMSFTHLLSHILQLNLAPLPALPLILALPRTLFLLFRISRTSNLAPPQSLALQRYISQTLRLALSQSPVLQLYTP